MIRHHVAASAAEIDSVFTLDTYLRNIDAIFERVFGEE